MNKSTLEQWRCLIAFAATGTYAKAGEMLFKTPSSVHQALAQLADRLGVQLIAVNGRTSRLTGQGEALLRRARYLVDEFDQLEALAGDFAAGWEAEIGLAAEAVFPANWLSEVLQAFAQECRDVRLQLYESVLSRTDDLLIRQDVDLAITPRIPAGFVGESLCSIPMLAVAHPQHPLHQMGPDITAQELLAHRQFVIRDTGSSPVSAGWQEAERRWTVGSFNRSLAGVKQGLGFGRFPEPLIAEDLSSGRLKPLPLREGVRFPVQMFLVFADRDRAGPAVLLLAKQIMMHCQVQCSTAK